MNCKQCGAALVDGDQFCKSCGAAVEGQGTEQGISGGAGQAMASQATVSAPTATTSTNPFMSAGSTQAQGAQSSWPGSGAMNTAGAMNSATPMFQPQKPANNSLKYIIIGIIAVVVIAAAVLITMMVINSGDKKKDTGSSSDKPGSSVIGSGEGGSGSGSTNKPTGSTYTFKAQGYTMEVPDDFVVEEDDGAIFFADDSGEWVVMLEFTEAPFSKFKANKSQVQQQLQRNGYTATPAKSETLGGVDCVTTDLTVGGQVFAAAFFGIGSNHIGGIMAANVDNEVDYGLIEMMAPVMKSLEYNPSSNNMSLDVKLGMDSLKELAQ